MGGVPPASGGPPVGPPALVRPGTGPEPPAGRWPGSELPGPGSPVGSSPGPAPSIGSAPGPAPPVGVPVSPEPEPPVGGAPAPPGLPPGLELPAAGEPAPPGADPPAGSTLPRLGAVPASGSAPVAGAVTGVLVVPVSEVVLEASTEPEVGVPDAGPVLGVGAEVVRAGALGTTVGSDCVCVWPGAVTGFAGCEVAVPARGALALAVAAGLLNAALSAAGFASWACLTSEPLAFGTRLCGVTRMSGGGLASTGTGRVERTAGVSD